MALQTQRTRPGPGLLLVPRRVLVLVLVLVLLVLLLLPVRTLPRSHDHAAHVLAEVAAPRVGPHRRGGLRVRVDEAEAQPRADGRVREKGRERGGQQLRELAQGARLPGVDLQVGGEVGRGVGGRGRARADRVGPAEGAAVAVGRRGGREVGERVEVVDAVEEFQVEGRCGLSVDLGFGRIASGHCGGLEWTTWGGWLGGEIFYFI